MIGRSIFGTACVAIAMALVIGCGGGSSSTPTPDPTPAPGPTPTPTPPTGNGPASDVVTFKYDVGRTGQYPVETTLTPANVNSTSFGLLRQLTVDGKVDAQPLYLSRLDIGGAAHNVTFVATEH